MRKLSLVKSIILLLLASALFASSASAAVVSLRDAGKYIYNTFNEDGPRAMLTLDNWSDCPAGTAVIGGKISQVGLDQMDCQPVPGLDNSRTIVSAINDVFMTREFAGRLDYNRPPYDQGCRLLEVDSFGRIIRAEDCVGDKNTRQERNIIPYREGQVPAWEARGAIPGTNDCPAGHFITGFWRHTISSSEKQAARFIKCTPTQNIDQAGKVTIVVFQAGELVQCPAGSAAQAITSVDTNGKFKLEDQLPNLPNIPELPNPFDPLDLIPDPFDFLPSLPNPFDLFDPDPFGIFDKKKFNFIEAHLFCTPFNDPTSEPAPEPEPESGGRIGGLNLDNNRIPVKRKANITVVFSKVGGPILGYFKSDSMGRFEFPDLTSGGYKVGAVSSDGVFPDEYSFCIVAEGSPVPSNCHSDWRTYNDSVEVTVDQNYYVDMHFNFKTSSIDVPSDPTTGLKVDDRIRVISDIGLKVRSSAAGADTGERQLENEQGVILSGPQLGNLGRFLYEWFNIDFDTGRDGWVAAGRVISGDIPASETYLEKITGGGDPTPIITSCPGDSCTGLQANSYQCRSGESFQCRASSLTSTGWCWIPAGNACTSGNPPTPTPSGPTPKIDPLPPIVDNSCQLGVRSRNDSGGLFQPTEFGIDDEIVILTAVLIRKQAGGEPVSYDENRVAQAGEAGKIIGGPITSKKINSKIDQDLYVWYQINYESGKLGWSAAGEVGSGGLSTQYMALKSVACPDGPPVPEPILFPGDDGVPSGGISVGDDIKVIADGGLRVRNVPGGVKIGATQPRGREGRVIGGSSRLTFQGLLYDWFNVDFDIAPDGWVAGLSLDPSGGIIDRFLEKITRAGSGVSPGDSSREGYRCFGSFHNNRMTGYSVVEIPNQSPGKDPVPGVSLGISNHQCVVCAPERVSTGDDFEITWATGGDVVDFKWSGGTKGKLLVRDTSPLPTNGSLIVRAPNNPGTSIVAFSSRPNRSDLADACIVPIVTTGRAPQKNDNPDYNYYCNIYGPEEVEVGEQFEVWYEAGGRTTGLQTKVASPRGWEGPVQARIGDGGQFVGENDPLLSITSNAGSTSYGLPMFPCNGNKDTDCTHTVQFTTAGTATLQLEVYGREREAKAICEYTVRTTSQTQGPKSLANPANLVAVDECPAGPSSIRVGVGWQPVLDANSYIVHRRPVISGEVYTEQATVNENRYTDINDLVLGQEYRYKVSACNAQGCSDTTDQSFVAVTPICPSDGQCVSGLFCSRNGDETETRCGCGVPSGIGWVDQSSVPGNEGCYHRLTGSTCSRALDPPPPPPPPETVACLNDWNNQTGGRWDGDGAGTICGCILFGPNGGQSIGPDNNNPQCLPPGLPASGTSASTGSSTGTGTTPPPAELASVCPNGVITKPSTEANAYITRHVEINAGQTTRFCAFAEAPYLPARRNSRLSFQVYDESDKGCASTNLRVEQLSGARIVREDGGSSPRLWFGINPAYLRPEIGGDTATVQTWAENETDHGKYLITVSGALNSPQQCNKFYVAWGWRGLDITDLVNKPVALNSLGNSSLANTLEGLRASLQNIKSLLQGAQF
jgi:hypothetical protein